MDDKIKLSKAWQRGFDAARAASVHSTGSAIGQKLGAALYAGSNLLSIGFNDWNRTSKHAQFDNYNGNVHAEVMCLVRRWHYEKSNNLILYVSRTTTNPERTVSKDGCSRPCSKCMNLVREYGIRRVRFFDESGLPTEIKF
jgi:deoxycytidylate deaminase